MSKFEKREVDGPKNVGLFALENIAKNSIIFREIPFYSFNKKDLVRYMTDENPTGNPDLDAEIRRLKSQVAMASKIYGKTGSSFNEKYPPNIRVYLDRLTAIVTENGFKSQSKDVQRKWMDLYDAHQDVRTDTTVGIFGLDSEKGKSLNGKIAYCRGFEVAKKRYKIKVDSNFTQKPEMILLKKENLKTVSGIFRSNAFNEGLFENRCRMNHACNANTETVKVSEYNRVFGRSLIPNDPNEFVTIANRNIESGEELTCRYVSKDKSLKARREELKEKYKFECKCEVCKNER